MGRPWRGISTRTRLLSQATIAPNGCWIWTGRINRDGYGMTGYKGSRNFGAHRAVYEVIEGSIPEGYTLDHRCHTDDLSCQGGVTCPHRRCVNPAHLEPVVRLENVMRGRSPVAINARKETCKYGHELIPGLYGRRRACRTCAVRRATEHKKRRKALQNGGAR